ncbi:MAG: hypothetical protein ACOH1T_03825 [Microbacteriaceae bacterium]
MSIPRVVSIVLGIALVFPLGGCGALVQRDSPFEVTARERVTQIVRSVTHQNRDDIYFYARAVDELRASEGGFDLIGITETTAATVTDVFGSLQLRIPAPDDADAYPESDTGPFCFTVNFTLYGAERSSSGGGDRAITSFECEENAPVVTPPADETVYPVLSANALEATQQVLAALGPELAAPDTIAASIAKLLDQPAGQFESAAVPSVEIHDGRVGVGIGDENDCVLVKLEKGVVTQVYAAPVQLQPGELGCNGGTSLRDDLGSPH